MKSDKKKKSVCFFRGKCVSLHRLLNEYMDMRAFRSIYIIVVVVLAIVACTGNSRSTGGAAVDSLYTEPAIRDIYGKEPERALVMIDSAVMLGNVTEARGDFLRAKVYGQAMGATREDTAIVICERLLTLEEVRQDPAFHQDVLEVLEMSARMLDDYELMLSANTELVDLCRRQGNMTEALRTEAEIGYALSFVGKTDEGLAKIDSVFSILNKVRKFNELDASILAMKRKITVLDNADRSADIIAAGRCIIDRLNDYEQHPADFHDGSYREPADEDRPGYIDFYRSQAYALMANAYAVVGERQKAKECIASFEPSDLGQTIRGRRLLAPTLCLLGEYDKMEAIYKELDVVFKERGDTISVDYAQMLHDRAVAAEAQGRMKESIALWQHYADIKEQFSDCILQGKAQLYAARYHAQEQQREIDRQRAEAHRNSIIAWAIGVIAILAIAFALWFFRQKRIVNDKNRVLVRQIKEIENYKDSPIKTQSPHEEREVSVESTSDADLYLHLREEILSNKLFLDPQFGRQSVIDQFHLSKERVGTIFKQGSDHTTITDFINNCRLDYARELLVSDRQMSIDHVAHASGFAQRQTFTRNFTKYYGLTPTEYRTQYLSSQD